MRLNRYAKYAWIVLIYNILVILWGAYVRATGSGAGCGSHWPLCNGEVLPRTTQIETMIEFGHRLTSGLAFILVLILFLWALRAYPRGNNVRLAAIFSMVFITTEALVGAGLVLFEWVAYDASVGRAISIVVHLINTFLLLASLSLTAWWASGGKAVRIKGAGVLLWTLLLGLLGTMVIGASGALTALGDTLFPVTSLAEGIQQ
ncbi:MAG: COX15/CtaA family protein, partial [Anaerolineales bacterium]